MPRGRTSFICRQCEHVSVGWLGRCPACGGWNTIEERTVLDTVSRGAAGQRPAAPQVVRLADVDPGVFARIDTGFAELNRVLGGGLVSGSVVLVGGEPGIGKSTLLLQALLRMEGSGVSTLLVSGEESAGQVKLRGRRLGDADGGLRLVTETETERVIACLEQLRPAVCVVDSIQTVWSATAASTAGSVAQIREATGQLLRVAKSCGIVLILVGHVTKEGELAGPRVMEHMVDAVLSFEGERAQPFRILRAAKNRFGSTNEVGIFQMGDAGLVEVADPSSVFLEEGHLRSGSVVVPVLEGSRCLLAEVQALVVPSHLTVPQRVARGVDRNRLAMIVAVLARRARLPLLNCDIFVNVAGGLVLDDPAADLAVALAVASAWQDGVADGDLAAFGEVSLTGKVRYVLQGDKRIQELTRRGLPRILVSARNAEEAANAGAPAADTRVEAVIDIAEAVKSASARHNHG